MTAREIRYPEDLDLALGLIDEKERVRLAFERILREQLNRKRGFRPTRHKDWPYDR